MTQHVWSCKDIPNEFQSLYVDDHTMLDPELHDMLMDRVQAYFQEKHPTQHTHIFGAQPDKYCVGVRVNHECPGEKNLKDITKLFIELGEKL